MKKAVYPGTFDPITFGHMDVIKRGMDLFDELVIGVTTNPRKKPFFSLKDRLALVQKTVDGLKNVKVVPFEGLLVEFAKKESAPVILRGLRELSDFEGEFQEATVNRKLNSKIETVFVMTSEKYFYLNSSIVREIASLGGNIGEFVPRAVEAKLLEKLK